MNTIQNIILQLLMIRTLISSKIHINSHFKPSETYGINKNLIPKSLISICITFDSDLCI